MPSRSVKEGCPLSPSFSEYLFFFVPLTMRLLTALWCIWLLHVCLADLCHYYNDYKIEFEDVLVMPTGPDFSACCGICLATPSCTVSVHINGSCYLKKFNRTVDNNTLIKAPGYITCDPIKHTTGPSAASYPPLPKPNISDTATAAPFPAGVRLDSGFPKISMENPEKFGFPGVEREGFASVDYNKLCLANGKTFPLPTNDWWTPIIRPTPETTLNYIFPVPYIYDFTKQGVHVQYPFIITSPGSVRNIINRFWTLSTIRSSDAMDFCVKHFDLLTATVQWHSGGEDDRTVMEMPMARGSPYVTIKYLQAQPLITTQQKLRAYFVDRVPYNCTGDAIKGHRFSVRLEDADEEWQLYVPPGTAVVCDSGFIAGRPYTTITLEDKAFTGYVRLALGNNCTTGMVPPSFHCAAEGTANKHMSHYLDALDDGSNACPMKGKVSTRPALGNYLELVLEWDVQKCWSSSFFSTNSLLMIALPHHLSRMDHSHISIVPSGGHRNTRGYNTPVRTYHNKWVMAHPRTTIPWVETPDAKRIPFLKNWLINNDSKFDLPPDVQRGYIDPYNAGKELSRVARLAIIADKLQLNDIADAFTKKLTAYISVWLDYKSANPLVFDKSWGGMISCGCTYVWLEQEQKARCANNVKSLECPVLRDVNADFGNGHFNDHHFHYGYFLYAAAVAAKLDPVWAKSYNDKVLLLLRDIANPNAEDPYFPQFRHFDWYLGHSWASGIVSSPNGKNQESTSEAVNAHYGIYLWGLATQHKPLAEMGELMMLTESHSAKYYWYGAGDVFPKGYVHDMAGIVHDLLFEFQTYFGPQTYFVHGIHVLPLTGATTFLLSRDWVAKSFPTFNKSCDADNFCMGSGFITFAHAQYALLDKDESWDRVLSLPDQGPFNVYDIGSGGGNGNSKTSTLWWVASVGNDPQPPDHYFDDSYVSNVDGYNPRANQHRHRHIALKITGFCAVLGAVVWAVREKYPHIYHESLGHIKRYTSKDGHYVQLKDMHGVVSPRHGL